MTRRADYEKAVFTEARRRSFRTKWMILLATLAALMPVYWAARDIVYHGLVYRMAQTLVNDLGSAAVERIGRVTLDAQGDVTLHQAETFTHRGGERRLFLRAASLKLALDGMPLRDEKLRVMRVDLFRPEFFLRREADGEWNVEWALQSAPRAPDDAPREPAPREDPWKDYLKADEGFPPNGVHIHDGILNIAFVGKSGKETEWRITALRAAIRRIGGVLTLYPATGDFYGGEISTDIEVTKTRPFTVRKLNVNVVDADVARMAAGAPYVKKDMKGRFDGVLALARDAGRTGDRPVAAGRFEVTDGDLWDVPAFSALIHLLSLSGVEDRRIDTAVVEFTVEEGQIRFDQMHFLGYPFSLFGDGACSLTGDWMEIVFVPRLGKRDWNSILPIIGAPIDLLSQLFNGAVLPVVLKGTFEKPEFGVEPFYFLKPKVERLLQEKSPR